MKHHAKILLLSGFGLMAAHIEPLHAQDSTPPPIQAASTPAIEFQILSEAQVTVGSHSVTYNLVSQPTMPEASPASPSIPSPEYLQWLHVREQKSFKNITLAATVYDHQLTDLRYSDGKVNCRVFSNIDFNNFAGTHEIETADTIYEYVVLLDNKTSDTLTQDNPDLPAFTYANQVTLGWLTRAEQQLVNLALNPDGVASYVVVDNPAGQNSDAIATLDAIHAYYTTNHAQIISAYEQRQVAWAAAEQYKKEHPLAHQDTVINYWPEINSVYLTTGTQGGNNQ